MASKNMKTKQLPGIGTDEAAGAGEATSPLGAQILKRMHEDAALLMQEYDSWMPTLEHDKVKGHLQAALENLESLMSDTEALHSKHYKDLPPLGGDAAMEEGEDFETKDGDELPDEVEGDVEIETKDGEELDEDIYDKDVDDPDAIGADSDEEEVPTPDEVVEGMDTKDFEEEEFEVEEKAMRHARRKSAEDEDEDDGGDYARHYSGANANKPRDMYSRSDYGSRDTQSDYERRQQNAKDRKSLARARRKALDGDDLTDDEKRLLRRAKAWHKSVEDEDEVDEKRLARVRRKAMDGEELDDDEKSLLRRAKGMHRKSACPACAASGKADCDCGSKSLRNTRRKDMDGDLDDLDALDKDMETADEMLGDLEESKGFGLEPHEKEEVKDAAKYLKELIDEHNYNDDHRHKSYAFHRAFDKMCKKYGGKSADADAAGMDPMLEQQKDMGGEADPNVAVLEQASKFFKALASEHAYGDGHRAEAAAHGKALEPLTLDEDKGFDDQTGDEFEDEFDVKAEDLPDVPDLDEEVKSEEMAPGYEPGEMGQKGFVIKYQSGYLADPTKSGVPQTLGAWGITNSKTAAEEFSTEKDATDLIWELNIRGAKVERKSIKSSGINRLKRLIVQQQKAMSDIGEKMKLIADRNGTR